METSKKLVNTDATRLLLCMYAYKKGSTNKFYEQITQKIFTIKNH